MSNLIRMAITPVTEGRFMAEVMLDNNTSASSKPFPSVDDATHWAQKFAEETEGKSADQEYGSEVQAGLHSLNGVPLEEMAPAE